MTTMLLGPRDPILLRDARTFDAEPGARAFTLPWPLPRTVAGAIRTHIGNHANPAFDWKNGGPDRARAIAVHGPLLVARPSFDAAWQPYVAAPRDHVALKPGDGKDAPDHMALTPWKDLPTEAGVTWGPGDGEVRPLRVSHDGKADSTSSAFWSLTDAWKWQTTLGRGSDPSLARPQTGLAALRKDVRTHVRIDPLTGIGLEGALFSVEGLVFPDVPLGGTQKSLSVAMSESSPEVRMLTRVATEETWSAPDLTFLPLGGERRLASIERDAIDWPAPFALDPEPDWDKVSGIRLLLVTPAIFTDGWKPGWASTTGVPPGCDLEDDQLSLVSAAVERPMPVSGWNIATRSSNATTFACRAGSVYFFEVRNRRRIREVFHGLRERLWLSPISDREQDRNDGFGIVLPGIW